MNSDRTCPPVLVLAFNRRDTTARVIESLRQVRPARLYFAVDGARANRDGEAEKVGQVQDLVRRIDWPCEVATLFRDVNLGCKLAVSGAISWFFDREDEGIILEDDCVAHPSFFPFATELLDRFREDERVMMVSGDNFQFGRTQGMQFSYYFSRHTHIWGWATWRRAWRLYDHGMSAWPELRDQGWLRDILGDASAVDYWTRIFDATHGERNTSWAYRWTYSCWIQSGLTILPAGNLVSNIGFDEHATHTKSRASRVANLPVEECRFPLVHPPFIARDSEADGFTERTVFRGASRVRRALGDMKRRLRRA